MYMDVIEKIVKECADDFCEVMKHKGFTCIKLKECKTSPYLRIKAYNYAYRRYDFVFYFVNQSEGKTIGIKFGTGIDGIVQEPKGRYFMKLKENENASSIVTRFSALLTEIRQFLDIAPEETFTKEF